MQEGRRETSGEVTGETGREVTAREVTGERVVIQCRDLRKTYDGKVEAVRGIDLTIYAGQCYGLLGPNGAGKTTTIEILEGLLEASSGTVEILGRTWREHPAELRESLGVSLQETRLAEKLTVRETLELFGGFYRNARPVDDVLEELALTEKADAWVGKLSGGQKQRLAIARALAMQPRGLLCDEITSALDPELKGEVLDVLVDLKREGMTLLMVTHEIGFARRAADRVVVLCDGRVLEEGPPAQVLDHPRTERMKVFLHRVLV